MLTSILNSIYNNIITYILYPFKLKNNTKIINEEKHRLFCVIKNKIVLFDDVNNMCDEEDKFYNFSELINNITNKRILIDGEQDIFTKDDTKFGQLKICSCNEQNLLNYTFCNQCNCLQIIIKKTKIVILPTETKEKVDEILTDPWCVCRKNDNENCINSTECSIYKLALEMAPRLNDDKFSKIELNPNIDVLPQFNFINEHQDKKEVNNEKEDLYWFDSSIYSKEIGYFCLD